MQVISNFLKYDEQGIIQGYQHDIIHVFNKNEFVLKNTKYYDVIRDRDNVILMGDSIGDAGMANGISHANAVIKIGFLYEHVRFFLLLKLQFNGTIFVERRKFKKVYGYV